MPISKQRVTKTLNLSDYGLDEVPASEREAVKREVGEFIITEILQHVGDAKSPVGGQRDFRSLTTGYAEREKGGDRTANLELEGDMLSALDMQSRPGSSIEIGIFDSGEAPKAHGHNTGFEGRFPKYKRQFIPDENQKFKSDIESGIREIIRGFQVPDVSASARPTTTLGITPETQEITLNDLLSDSFIQGLFDGL